MVTGAREQADTRAVRWRPRSRACRRSRRARLPAWTSTETDFERASRFLWRRAARGPRPLREGPGTHCVVGAWGRDPAGPPTAADRQSGGNGGATPRRETAGSFPGWRDRRGRVGHRKGRRQAGDRPV